MLQLMYGSAESVSSESSGGVVKKILKEPVLIIALIYNPVQVVLCGLPAPRSCIRLYVLTYILIQNILLTDVLMRLVHVRQSKFGIKRISDFEARPLDSLNV